MAEGKCCHLRATSVTALILLSTLLSLSLITTLPVSSAENIVNGLNSSIINEESFPTPDSNITNPQRAFDGNNASVHNQAHLVAKNCDGPGNCEAMAYSYIIYELSFLGVTDFVNLTFFYESYGEQDQFSDWRDPSGLIISFTVEDADGKTEVLNQSSTGGAEIILELYPGPFHLTQQRTLSLNISVFHTSSDYSADQANLRLYEVEAASADPPPNYNDSDSDGVDDSLDQCPGYDDSIDVDDDGIPDDCDSLIDNDGDGVANSVDECEGHDDNIDVDQDGTPDGCDSLLDNDGDGVANSVDECEGYNDSVDVDQDSIPDGCDPLIDSDGDGVSDNDDQCPETVDGATVNEFGCVFSDSETDDSNNSNSSNNTDNSTENQSTENNSSGDNNSIVNDDTDANSSVGADGEETLSTKRIIAIVWIVISIGVLIWLWRGWYEIDKSSKKLFKEIKENRDNLLIDYFASVDAIINEAEENAEMIRKTNRHKDFIKFDLCLKTEGNYSIVTGEIWLPEMVKGEVISFSAMDGKNVLKGDKGRDFWIPCEEFISGSVEEKDYRMIAKKLRIAPNYSLDSLSRLYDLKSTPSELLKIRCEEDIQHVYCEDDEGKYWVPAIDFAFTSIGCREPTGFKCKYGEEEITIPIEFDEYVEFKDVNEARYNWVRSIHNRLVHPKQQATINLILKLGDERDGIKKVTYIGPDDGANLVSSLWCLQYNIEHLNIVAADASMGRDSNDIKATSDWKEMLWFWWDDETGEDVRSFGDPAGEAPTVSGFTHSDPTWHNKTKSHLIIDTYTVPWWPDILIGLENRMAHLTNGGVLILVLPKDVSSEPFEGADQKKVDDLVDILKNCPVHEHLGNVLGYAISKKDWDAIKPEESKYKPKPKKPDLTNVDPTKVTQNFNAPVENVAAGDIVINNNKRKKKRGPFNPFAPSQSKRKKPRRRGGD